MDVEEANGILNKAFADEWSAYYRKKANEIGYIIVECLGSCIRLPD